MWSPNKPIEAYHYPDSGGWNEVFKFYTKYLELDSNGRDPVAMEEIRNDLRYFLSRYTYTEGRDDEMDRWVKEVLAN